MRNRKHVILFTIIILFLIKMSSYSSTAQSENNIEILAEMEFDLTMRINYGGSPDILVVFGELWIPETPGGMSYGIPNLLLTPQEPGRYDALELQDPRSDKDEIIETLKDGNNNKLEFMAGLFSNSGEGSFSRMTPLDRSNNVTVTGLESDWFGRNELIEAPDLFDIPYISIVLQVNELSFTGAQSTYLLTIDVKWIFYGSTNPITVIPEDLSGSETSPNENQPQTLYLSYLPQIGLFLVIIGSLVGSMYLWKNERWLFSRPPIQFTKEIISHYKQLFNGDSGLMISISGVMYSKDPPDDLKVPVPNIVSEKLMQFKFLLHPARMTILKILFHSIECTIVELKTQLGVSWSEISFHLKTLEEKQLIRTHDKFVESSVRRVVELLPEGVLKFRELSLVLKKFLTDNSSISSYLDTANKLASNDEDVKI